MMGGSATAEEGRREAETEAEKGWRTPKATERRIPEPAAAKCPAAPRKRRSDVARPSQPPQLPRKDFYAGPDLDAFFAAHNL